MSRKALSRWLAPLAIATVVLAAPTAAQADQSLDINQGNVPTTAEGHGDHSCDQVPVDTGADQDGWVFVLPGKDGEFISVTATFTDLNGDSHTYTTDANGGIADSPSDEATSKAYIITPAGWTLTGATAQVTDDADAKFFNLTHTCPGTPGSGTPTPSESPSHSDTPSGSESPGQPSVTPSGDDTLPTTGVSLTTALVTGTLLAALGAVALVLMRRRRAATEWGQS